MDRGSVTAGIDVAGPPRVPNTLESVTLKCCCESSPRELVAGSDARTLARGLPAMTGDSCRAAFRDAPMKRAKLTGLKRNAAVVLGNAGHRGELPAR